MFLLCYDPQYSTIFCFNTDLTMYREVCVIMRYVIYFLLFIFLSSCTISTSDKSESTRTRTTDVRRKTLSAGIRRRSCRDAGTKGTASAASITTTNIPACATPGGGGTSVTLVNFLNSYIAYNRVIALIWVDTTLLLSVHLESWVGAINILGARSGTELTGALDSLEVFI